MRFLILLGLCLFALPLSAAQYYKWTDPQGEVHYSDRPPAGGNYQTLPDVVIPTPPEAKTSYERAGILQQAQLQAQAAKAEQQALAREKAQRTAIRAENCRRAQANLETLESHTRLLLIPEDGEGEPTRMPEEERQRRLAEARTAVAEYCN